MTVGRQLKYLGHSAFVCKLLTEYFMSQRRNNITSKPVISPLFNAGAAVGGPYSSNQMASFLLDHPVDTSQ